MLSIRLEACISGLGLVLAAMMPAMPGCSLQIETLVEPVPIDEPTDKELVRIRFVNLADGEGVEVEFYTTNEPLEAPPDGLFVAANLMTEGIGFLGSGAIGPGQDDTIDLPCTENLTIGTRGGTFVDDESGLQRGVGTTRYAQQGPLALCGSTVTFIFDREGTEFTTNLTVGE